MFEGIGFIRVWGSLRSSEFTHPKNINICLTRVECSRRDQTHYSRNRLSTLYTHTAVTRKHTKRATWSPNSFLSWRSKNCDCTVLPDQSSLNVPRTKVLFRSVGLLSEKYRKQVPPRQTHEFCRLIAYRIWYRRSVVVLSTPEIHRPMRTVAPRGRTRPLGGPLQPLSPVWKSNTLIHAPILGFQQ